MHFGIIHTKGVSTYKERTLIASDRQAARRFTAAPQPVIVMSRRFHVPDWIGLRADAAALSFPPE
jgi:hypothetical protein